MLRRPHPQRWWDDSMADRGRNMTRPLSLPIRSSPPCRLSDFLVDRLWLLSLVGPLVQRDLAAAGRSLPSPAIRRCSATRVCRQVRTMAAWLACSTAHACRHARRSVELARLCRYVEGARSGRPCVKVWLDKHRSLKTSLLGMCSRLC